MRHIKSEKTAFFENRNKENCLDIHYFKYIL